MRFSTLLISALALATWSHAASKVAYVGKDKQLFWAAVEKGAVETAEAKGIGLIVKSPGSASMVEQQIKLIGSIDPKEISVLLLGPLMPENLGETLDPFVKAGVKIVTIETPVEGGHTVAHVTLDQKGIGEAAGKHLVAALKDGDEIAVMRANSVEGISLREKTVAATCKALMPKSVMHLDIKTGMEKNDDYAQCIRLLETYPGIKGVITPFSMSSNAMIKALEDKGLAGKIVHIGVGTGLPEAAATALAKGTMQAWISQNPRLMGVRAMEMASVIIEGKTPQAVVNVEFFVITKANLESPEVKALR